MVKKLKITQVKSGIGRNKRQRRTLEALGIRKMHQTVIHNDTPSIRGMITKVSHLVEFEEFEGEEVESSEEVVETAPETVEEEVDAETETETEEPESTATVEEAEETETESTVEEEEEEKEDNQEEIPNKEEEQE
jgi:large subunit ribosomal protein L30